MNYEDFGSLFAAKRKEKGYTQKTIAAVLHTTDKSISRWETNKRYDESYWRSIRNTFK